MRDDDDEEDLGFLVVVVVVVVVLRETEVRPSVVAATACWSLFIISIFCFFSEYVFSFLFVDDRWECRSMKMLKIVDKD